jgi:hypothetical protein
VADRIKLALICLIGMVIGLFSARYIANGGLDLVAVSHGPWKTWSSAGLNNMDPYTKAHYLAAGRLADNRREIVEYEATTDEEGRTLDRSCTYAIAGDFGWSRWWSITVIRDDGGLDRSSTAPASLQSEQVVFEGDGSAVIWLSGDTHTGNWLAMPVGGDPRLIMRYYDPAPASRARPADTTLPRLKKEACR